MEIKGKFATAISYAKDVLDNLFTENRGSGIAVANAAAAAALPVFYFAKRSCCGMINKTNG